MLTGKAPARTSPDEITLFKSLGIAIEDLAAAHARVPRRRGARAWAPGSRSAAGTSAAPWRADAWPSRPTRSSSTTSSARSCSRAPARTRPGPAGSATWPADLLGEPVARVRRRARQGRLVRRHLRHHGRGPRHGRRRPRHAARRPAPLPRLRAGRGGRRRASAFEFTELTRERPSQRGEVRAHRPQRPDGRAGRRLHRRRHGGDGARRRVPAARHRRHLLLLVYDPAGSLDGGALERLRGGAARALVDERRVDADGPRRACTPSSSPSSPTSRRCARRWPAPPPAAAWRCCRRCSPWSASPTASRSSSTP